MQQWLGLSGIAYGKALAGGVRDMTRRCLYCAETKTGVLVPRTLERTPHGRKSNAVVPSDCLYKGESAMDAGIDAANGIQYVLAILEDVSGYTWLQPSRACTENGTMGNPVRWYATLGPPTAWVSDNATQFRNSVVRKRAKALGVGHRFSVTNSAWANGTVVRMTHQLIHGAKAILNKGRTPFSEWAVVLLAVQWALNTAWLKKHAYDPLPRHDGA